MAGAHSPRGERSPVQAASGLVDGGVGTDVAQDTVLPGWRRTLRSGLFPPAAEPSRPALTMVGYATAFALLTAVSLLRQPGVPATNTVWAEDGRVFYVDAIDRPFLADLFRPYNGYMHLAPRVEAELATLFPIGYASDVIAVCAAMSVAALALVVYRASAGQLPSRLVRAFLAFAVVAVPIGTQETLNNLANLHWYLMFAALWVLLWVPRSWWGVGVSITVVVFAAGSDPQTLLLLPLVVLRVLARVRRSDRYLALAFAGACAVQLAVVIGVGKRSMPATTPTLPDLGQSYGLRVALAVFAGVSGTKDMYHEWGLVPIVAAAILLSAALAFAVARGGTTAWVAVVATVVSLTYYAVAAVLTWGPSWLPHRARPGLFVFSRYTVLPILCLLLVLLAALAAAPRGWVRRLVCVAVVAGLLVPVAIDFRVGNVRARGPAWSAQVEQARVRCAGEPDGRSVDIGISPRPWRARLTCGDLQ